MLHGPEFVKEITQPCIRLDGQGEKISKRLSILSQRRYKNPSAHQLKNLSPGNFELTQNLDGPVTFPKKPCQTKHIETQTCDKDLLFLELFAIDCYNAFAVLMESVDLALRHKLPKLVVPPTILTNPKSHPSAWELLRLLMDSLPSVYSYFFDSPESAVALILTR